MKWVLRALCMGVMLAGCGNPASRQCMNAGGAGDLVTSAALIKLDIYAGGTGCAGNRPAPGAAAPQLSRSFAAGEAIRLDIPPGRHTVVLTAFADAAGAQAIGGACTDEDFQPGQAVCLDLILDPTPDLAVPDLPLDMAVCQGAECPCTPTSDNCPIGQYCVAPGQCSSGCKTNTDCVAMAPAVDGGTLPGVDGGMPPPAQLLCDPTAHHCVECVKQTDCATGKVCSPAGACVDGCDLAKGKGCTPGITCCALLCIDTLADTFNCGPPNVASCGMACTGGATLCCNGSCANPNSDKMHCGGCFKQCSTLNGTPNCALGVCSWACDAGFAHCGAGNTGCQTDVYNDPSNCGGCGKVCSNNNIASPTCTSPGVCNGTCNGSFADCDGDKLLNGCEINLNATATCGTACGTRVNCSTSVQNATSIGCASGACTFTCNANFANCDSNAANGCETSLNATATCGTTCGNKVDCTTSVQNATAIGCSAGSCTFTCNSGFGNCDGVASNGCETNLNLTAGCGTTCAGRVNCTTSVQNATSIGCSAGACTFTCNGGFGNCDATASNGCETNLNATATCGATCAARVNCSATVLNATGIGCSAGACTFTCNAGFADCDSIASNGCETNLRTDVLNCNACGVVCSTNNIARTCGGGPPAACNGTCTSGFADCNLNKQTDGCEINTNTDILNCGACGTVCSTNNIPTRTCGPPGANGTCTGACAGGTADCNLNKQIDGCEINTTNDKLNCAACGNVCSSNHITTPTCASSSCNGACDANFLDCDANKLSNGCECATGQPNTGICCAGGTCQTKHWNGLSAFGNVFYDCAQCQGTGASCNVQCTSPIAGCSGTWNQTEAMNACLAWVANAGLGGACNLYTCGGAANKVVCADAPAPCACWGYAGVPLGHAFKDPGCTLCPGAADPFWY